MHITTILKVAALAFTTIITASCSSYNYKESDEYLQYEKLLEKNSMKVDTCIGTHIQQYSKNSKASHTEVAEATLMSCIDEIDNWCFALIEMHSLGISSYSHRQNWKHGKKQECIIKRRDLIRSTLITDMVQNRW